MNRLLVNCGVIKSPANFVGKIEEAKHRPKPATSNKEFESWRKILAVDTISTDHTKQQNTSDH